MLPACLVACLARPASAPGVQPSLQYGQPVLRQTFVLFLSSQSDSVFSAQQSAKCWAVSHLVAVKAARHEQLTQSRSCWDVCVRLPRAKPPTLNLGATSQQHLCQAAAAVQPAAVQPAACSRLCGQQLLRVGEGLRCSHLIPEVSALQTNKPTAPSALLTLCNFVIYQTTDEE